MVNLRDGVWTLLIWIVLLNVLPLVSSQTSQGLFWDLELEEDFLMYELVFRNAEGMETEHSVNLTFSSELPEIPENLVNWSQIPHYPVSMTYSNGTELTNLSRFIPKYVYTVLPVGNWEYLSTLALAEFNDSTDFEVDNVDSDYWEYSDRWDENGSIYSYSYSFAYNKENGLISYASLWAGNKYEGGHTLWSVHFQRDREFNSPLPVIYTAYTIIAIGSLASILIWIRRTDRF
ncbi:MAG: hypothetical protein ACTSQZ_00875 [Candidatus Thorarchaeota archaeon]